MGHSGPTHGWSYPRRRCPFPHQKFFTLATPCLPVDEAIVTFTVRPSLTKQAGPPIHAGPSPLILKVLVRADAPVQSKFHDRSWFQPTGLTYHLHAVPTRVACSRICYRKTPFLLQHPWIISHCCFCCNTRLLKMSPVGSSRGLPPSA